MAFRIVFLPFDGFSNMVLASAIEPLRAACDLSGRQLFDWCVATPGGAAASPAWSALHRYVTISTGHRRLCMTGLHC